ncbi:hypothetical protein APHAL10511_001661 [Amanita phalloides]|nr:hypothetical protein APHAL10511_001661 [Amanita phalloides]
MTKKHPIPAARQKHLRPFFWNTLSPTSVSPTTWNDIDVIPFDLDNLEGIFTLGAAAGNIKAAPKPSHKEKVTTLLYINRANHIAIMIKMSLPDIRNVMIELDDNKLSIDNLRTMSRYLPTPDEIARLKEYGEVGKLAKADQYFTQTPRLSERLTCMVYRRKLELDVEEVRPELDQLKNASRELRTSHKFEKVLQAVLAVGNALNISTFRGSAQGFKLNALIKNFRTWKLLLDFRSTLLCRRSLFKLVYKNFQNGIKQLQQARNMPSNDRFIQLLSSWSLTSLSKRQRSQKHGDITSENAGTPEAPKYEVFFVMIVSFSSLLQV